MSELRLFSIDNGKAKECRAASYKLERELQNLFEANLEELLGVRFVASEFSTGQGGRIDTLGIDENGFPVVIEYKLDKNRTVINQGMAYMAWLRSHKAEFWKVVFEKLGKEVADAIDHSSTRLICIAADFTRDDLGAYELIPNSIDLVRYRRFGDDQLLLERITSSDMAGAPSPVAPTAKTGTDKTISQWLEEAKPEIRSLYESLRKAILSQGEDVSEKATKFYIAFKRTRNFASVTYPSYTSLNLYLHVKVDDIEMREGLRDVRSIGHWGTGDLEVKIKSQKDIDEALPLIRRAYEGQV
jgi:predicted transport protein